MQKEKKCNLRKTCLKKAKKCIVISCGVYAAPESWSKYTKTNIQSSFNKLEAKTVGITESTGFKTAPSKVSISQHPLCKHTHSVRKIFIWCLPLRIYDLMSQCKAKQENYESQTHTLSLSHRPDTFLGL